MYHGPGSRREQDTRNADAKDREDGRYGGAMHLPSKPCGPWMTGEIYAASGGRALGFYGAGDSSPGFDVNVPPITLGGKLWSDLT